MQKLSGFFYHILGLDLLQLKTIPSNMIYFTLPKFQSHFKQHARWHGHCRCWCRCRCQVLRQHLLTCKLPSGQPRPEHSEQFTASVYCNCLYAGADWKSCASVDGRRNWKDLTIPWSCTASLLSRTLLLMSLLSWSWWRYVMFWNHCFTFVIFLL